MKEFASLGSSKQVLSTFPQPALLLLCPISLLVAARDYA